MKMTCLQTLAVFLIGASSGAFANDAQPHKLEFNIPAQSMSDSLNQIADKSNLRIIYFSTDTQHLSAPAVSGAFTAEAALQTVLANSGLWYLFKDERTVQIRARSSNEVKGNGVSDNAAYEISEQMQVAQASGTTVSPPAVDAQESLSSKQSNQKIDEVIVTGTHIRGAEPVGSRVVVIDREEIRRSGYGRVEDIFENLTQNFNGGGERAGGTLASANLNRGEGVNLRGLGVGATLVLVNGRRQPAGGMQGYFVDVSSIAASAIERVEILADGASALYGSDAIGGVVNFILRKDYDGQETEAYFSSADGHAEEFKLSQLFGRNWDEGNVLLQYQYLDRDALMNADTAYGVLNRDLRSLGGSDYRFGPGVPGYIRSPVTFQPAFSFPAAQNGTNLNASQLVPGQSTFPDWVTGIAQLPENKMHSASLSLSQSVGDRFDVFLEGRFGKRKMTAPTQPIVSLFTTVPNTNPFYVNPFPTNSIFVDYNFTNELGLSVLHGDTETYTVATGGSARLTDRWLMSASAAYGREKNQNAYTTINASRLTSCLSGIASSGCPGAPLNLLGNGSANDPTTINYIRAYQLAEGVSTVKSVNVMIDGPVFNLPAGTVNLAAGADYRDEELEAQTGSFLPAGEVSVRNATSVGTFDRQVEALFAELLLPVLKSQDAFMGIRSVDLSLAGRYEDYSDFGTTFNPKIGLNLKSSIGLQLRATWSSSFRAPPFSQLSPSANPSSAAVQLNIVDPRSPTGRSNAIFLNGANEGLTEETAGIWTAGFDLTPLSLPGLTISATYFNVDYDNMIATGGSGANTLQTEDQWSELIVRNPTAAQIAAVCTRADFSGVCPPAVGAIIDTRLRNLARVEVRGIDLDTRYVLTTGVGDFRFGIAGTYFLDYRQAASSTAPLIDVLGLEARPVDLRLRGQLGWSLGHADFNVFGNYVDNYEQLRDGRPINSWTTVDANFGYRFDSKGWIGGTRINLGLLNAFDEKPPFSNNTSGFDATNSAQIGRVAVLNISKEW